MNKESLKLKALLDQLWNDLTVKGLKHPSKSELTSKTSPGVVLGALEYVDRTLAKEEQTFRLDELNKNMAQLKQANVMNSIFKDVKIQKTIKGFRSLVQKGAETIVGKTYDSILTEQGDSQSMTGGMAYAKSKFFGMFTETMSTPKEAAEDAKERASNALIKKTSEEGGWSFF